MRPLDLGDVLDGTFRLLKADWRGLLFLTAVFYAPLSALTTWIQRDLLTGPSVFESMSGAATGFDVADLDAIFLGSFVVTALVYLLVEPVVEGAIARIAASSYLGRTTSWQEAAGVALRRAPALIAARVLFTVLALLPFVPGLLLVIGAIVADSVALGVVGALALLLGVLGTMLLWALFLGSTPAIVVEGLGPVEGLRRSARLLRPRLWPVLGIAVLTYLVAALVGGVIGFPLSIAGELFGGAVRLVLVAIATILQGMLTRPLVVIPHTLLYFDGRVRREGLDLELATGQGGRGW